MRGLFRERSFWGLALGLGLLVFYGLFSFSGFTARDLNAGLFWELKTHHVQDVDMVLMGNSMVYRDLSPEAMNAVLPHDRILNFGYSSGGLNPVMFREAEERLDPQSARKAVVLGLTLSSLCDEEYSNRHFLSVKGEQPEPFAFLAVSAFFKPFLRTVLFERGAAWVRALLTGAQAVDEMVYHPDGWAESRGVKEGTGRIRNWDEFALWLSRFEPRFLEQLLDQTRIWTERGIRVYGFRPPVESRVFEYEDVVLGFDEDEFVKRFGKAGGTWLAIDPLAYFAYDGTHLESREAKRLSRDLAILIRDAREQTNDPAIN